jgi:hypothetical protein
MDEILINTNTTGDQNQPSVAGFRNTQFVVVWADTPTGDIKGQLLGVNGVKTDAEFKVNFPAALGTKRQLPTVVETGQGFVVAWIETAPGGKPQVRLRTFDQDSLSGPEADVSTAEVEPLMQPALARLADDGFVVVWADKRGDERIRGQRFGADGAKSGPEFRANTTPGLHRVPMVAGLTNGNFVVGWRARLIGNLHLRLQIFDASGPVGNEQVPNIEITDAVMAPLDSGRFVVAHIRSAGDGEPGFDTTIAQASLFEANGAFVSRFPARNPGRILSFWPALAPLPGGRFLLGWTELNVDNEAAGTSVKARLFSSQGPLGQVVQVNTLTGGSRTRLSTAATAGPDGEIALPVWADDSKAGADQSGRAIEGRPMSIPAGGF